MGIEFDSLVIYGICITHMRLSTVMRHNHNSWQRCFVGLAAPNGSGKRKSASWLDDEEEDEEEEKEEKEEESFVFS